MSDGPSRKRPRGEDRRKPDDPTSAFKALAPDSLVSMLIGKGGDARKQMEEEHGVRIKFSGRDEMFPGTKFRVVTVMSDSTDRVVAALFDVVEKLVDCAKRDAEKGGGKGGKDAEATSLTGKEPGEYIFRLALPQACTGRLIGSGGKSIKMMRESIGAKVFVENETHEMNQMVRVIGEIGPIQEVLKQVCTIIDEELPVSRVAQWAAQSLSGGDSYRGSDDRDRDGGHGGRKQRRGKRGGGGGGDNWDHGRDRDDDHHRGRDADWDRDQGNDHYQDEPPPDTFYEDEMPFSQGEVVVNGEAISRLEEEFPPENLGMNHLIYCELENKHVGALIGRTLEKPAATHDLQRKGEFIHQVQKETGTDINFNEVNKGDAVETRTLTIVGPLVAVYLAHMKMLKRYHEAVAVEEQRKAEEEQRNAAPQDNMVDDLKEQLAALQKRLEEAEGGNRDGGGKGGGKRKGGKGKR